MVLSEFDPYDKLVEIKGKDYLEAKWRIFWFRDAFPEGTIETTMVHLDMDKKEAVVHATVRAIKDGAVVGVATGMKIGKPRGSITGFVELAETGAIARALGALGFGTQFVADEFETTDDPELADAPVDIRTKREEKADPKPKKPAPKQEAPKSERGDDDDPLVDPDFAASLKARCDAAVSDGLIERADIKKLVSAASDGQASKIAELTMSEAVTLGIELDEKLES